MPVTVIQDPSELEVYDSTVMVRTEVVTNNETLFDMLFAAETYCLSLDEAQSYCWPIHHRKKQLATFYRLPDGMHTLMASITHPYNGEMIEVNPIPKYIGRHEISTIYLCA